MLCYVQYCVNDSIGYVHQGLEPDQGLSISLYLLG